MRDLLSVGWCSVGEMRTIAVMCLAGLACTNGDQTARIDAIEERQRQLTKLAMEPRADLWWCTLTSGRCWRDLERCTDSTEVDGVTCVATGAPWCFDQYDRTVRPAQFTFCYPQLSECNERERSTSARGFELAKKCRRGDG